MATTAAQRKQHLNLVGAQMEMSSATAAGISTDFEGKLEDAQQQLEYLHQQREHLERQKVALEELNQRKQDFMHGQVDLTEKMTSAITSIDRELFEAKQDIEDMEQARVSFAKHLQRIESLNPESWSKEQLREELEKAIAILERADDEYDQAVAHFSGAHRSAGIFGPSTGRSPRTAGGDFRIMLKNGFAFNLPVIVLGSLGLLVYFVK
ncbi:MAG: hypothetical protein ACN4GG_11200 [Akkermansiaceae bacterium]